MSEEEIRIGDEVLSDIGISSSKGLVLAICNNGVKILWQDLRCTTWTYEGAKSIKTGRNFPQIAEVLKQMKEPQDSEVENGNDNNKV